MPILENLYGSVWIPPAVIEELDLVIPDFRKSMSLTYPYLRSQMPHDLDRIEKLRQRLDAGESEAIALAMEIKADYLLIDEFDGRAIARSLGIEVTGVIGVLSRAKSANLVKKVRPLLDELETGLNFFIGTKFKEQALKALGE